MWNVGNEVLIFTHDEQERIAFCRFLEELIQEIHRIDPNHPVVYSDAAHVTLKYLKNYVPSLDIMGMNIYGSMRAAHGGWDSLNVDWPYLITEGVLQYYVNTLVPVSVSGNGNHVRQDY